MKRTAGILMLGLLAACGAGGARAVFEAGDAGALDTGACALDADCPSGMTCERCSTGGPFVCVPGCRDDAACGPLRRCFHDIACSTCPCPSGWCDLDPCRDADGDGFAAAREGSCPLPIGDCDDLRAAVHPGVLERCGNGLDDDCDGRVDVSAQCRADCQRQVCTNALYCPQGQGCQLGCCEACPAVASPTCGAGECLVGGGTSSTGCALAGTCVACDCSADVRPVCGVDFGTYENDCWRARAGVDLLHDGPCSAREGLDCVVDGDCFGDQFCRGTDAGARCSLRGTCSVDADCLKVRGVVACGDAGAARLRCEALRCVPHCD